MALLNANLLSISISTNEDITSQISIAKLTIVNKQAGMRLLKVTEVNNIALHDRCFFQLHQGGDKFTTIT